jgi:type IV pilus assembly protein PilZ
MVGLSARWPAPGDRAEARAHRRASTRRVLDTGTEKGYALFMSGRGVGDSQRPNGAAHGAAAAHIDEDDAHERRSTERVDVLWSVDCETEDTFLYAAITNISEMGIFVRTIDPLAVGTSVTLRFAPPHASEAFVLGGVVAWVNRVRPRADNPNPGMGIRFAALTLDDRERIVEAIRTIAYLREEPKSHEGQSDPRN